MWSRKALKNFLEKQYMKRGGADNLDIAIRDCLTDIYHIIEDEKLPTDMTQRLKDAKDVFYVELASEKNPSIRIREIKGKRR